MLEQYRRTEQYKQEGNGFLVMVSHHTVEALDESGCFDRTGPHRWCVYAYIYPSHPHFKAFDGTETMWQSAATAMPGHGDPSLVRVHTGPKPTYYAGSYQVGWDYNHLHDWSYTQMETPEDALSVFRDADRLFDWLAERDRLTKLTPEAA